MEPKILPPSMRPSKRYIVYQIVSDSPVNYIEFINTLWQTSMEFLGELGSAETGVWFVHNSYSTASQTGMIKCRHDKVEEVRAALSLISVVSEAKCIVKILGVTGTIKSANEKYIGDKNGV